MNHKGTEGAEERKEKKRKEKVGKTRLDRETGFLSIVKSEAVF
jgi:hypothetical protein